MEQWPSAESPIEAEASGIVNDLESDNSGSDSREVARNHSHSQKRPDLEGEEYRDSTFYEPISTREYFKLLGYCLVGLFAVGLIFTLISILSK